MKKNIGLFDKIVRIVVGLVLIVYGVIESTYLGFIGIIPILTAFISWCPLYCPLKINTSSKGCEK